MSDVEMQEQKEVEPTEDKSSSSCSSGTTLLWMVAVAALVVAVGSAVLLVRSTQNEQRVSREVVAQNALWLKAQENQQHMAEQFAQQQSSLQNLLVTVEQQRLASNKDQTGAVLAEVNYLVRLADYNARYRGDAKVVLAMLETAEQRMSTLTTPISAEVRAALVADITTLKAVPSVDVEGIMLRLNALSDVVAELSIIVPGPSTTNQSAELLSSAGANGWRDKLYSILESLKKVVVVRHLSEPVKPLLAPEQQSHLVANIQAKLSLAQWALLHHAAKTYTAAITQAEEWVGHYFTESDAARAVIIGLKELEKIDIKPAMPDLSATISLLDRVIQNHKPYETGQMSGEAAGAITPSSPAQRSPQSATPEAATSPPQPSQTPVPSQSLTPGLSPAPATPPRLKPRNPAEPEVISS